jgi:hypothetical protein
MTKTVLMEPTGNFSLRRYLRGEYVEGIEESELSQVFRLENLFDEDELESDYGLRYEKYIELNDEENDVIFTDVLFANKLTDILKTPQYIIDKMDNIPSYTFNHDDEYIYKHNISNLVVLTEEGVYTFIGKRGKLKEEVRAGRCRKIYTSEGGHLPLTDEYVYNNWKELRGESVDQLNDILPDIKTLSRKQKRVLVALLTNELGE